MESQDKILSALQHLGDELVQRLKALQLKVQKSLCLDYGISIAKATFPGVALFVPNQHYSVQIVFRGYPYEFDGNFDRFQIRLLPRAHPYGGGRVITLRSRRGVTDIDQAFDLSSVAKKFAAMNQKATLEEQEQTEWAKARHQTQQHNLQIQQRLAQRFGVTDYCWDQALRGLSVSGDNTALDRVAVGYRFPGAVPLSLLAAVSAVLQVQVGCDLLATGQGFASADYVLLRGVFTEDEAARVIEVLIGVLLPSQSTLACGDT